MISLETVMRTSVSAKCTMMMDARVTFEDSKPLDRKTGLQLEIEKRYLPQRNITPLWQHEFPGGWELIWLRGSEKASWRSSDWLTGCTEVFQAEMRREALECVQGIVGPPVCLVCIQVK